MNIGGFQTQSTVDYPGRLAAVIFTIGCNFNCTYCHNRRLLGDERLRTGVPQDEVLASLKRRRRFLDGVVVTGGEPTLQPDLESFLRRLRDMGYSIKLDTNGSRPGVLKNLIDQGLVDFIAMDVKAPISRYPEICDADVDVAAVQASISLLREERIDYEFRTTLAPQLTRTDLDVVRWMVADARSHVLQKCRPVEDAPPLALPRGETSLVGLKLENLRDQLAALPSSMKGRLAFRGLGLSAAAPTGDDPSPPRSELGGATA